MKTDEILERMKEFYHTRINRDMVKVPILFMVEYDVQAWQSQRFRNTGFPAKKCFGFVVQTNGGINGKLKNVSIKSSEVTEEDSPFWPFKRSGSS